MSTTCGTIRIIPGSKGDSGNSGTNGVSGASAVSYLTAQLVWPAEGANVVASVDQTAWLSPNDYVYVQNGGWMSVQGITNNSITLQNVKNTAALLYLANVAPGTVIPIASRIVAAGLQGPAGTNGTSGAATNLHYLTTQTDAALTNSFSLGSLASGLLKHAVAAGVSTPAKAIDGTDYLSPTTGLAVGTIGSTVEAHSAILDSLAGVAGAADKVAYFTGLTTMAMAAFTSFARGLVAAVDAPTARAYLGLVPGYGLLGTISGLNLNAGATDTAFTINATRYIIDRIVVDNASINTTTATLGVFTAAGGGGTTLAADQSLAALTATSKFLKLTLQAVTGTDARTEATLYARVGTPQGAGDTSNLYLYGFKIA